MKVVRGLVRPAAALVLVAAPVAAQGKELGLHLVGTASVPEAVALLPEFSWRPGGRVRVALSAGAGVASDAWVFRGEAMVHAMMQPRRGQGTGWYLGAGLATRAGRDDGEFLVLTAGVEASPGARAGWHVELGVGGGTRLAAGYRWRWFPAGWRPDRN